MSTNTLHPISRAVPGGTSSDSVLERKTSPYSNTGSCQAQDAASEETREKTYRVATARGAEYVVRATTPKEAFLKAAVLRERMEADFVRKDDKDAYDLLRAERRGDRASGAELSYFYEYVDARPYGAQRPHWLYATGKEPIEEIPAEEAV